MSADKLVLMTAGNSPFARAIMVALSPGHRFRAVDVDFSPGLPSQVEVCQGDLRDPAVVASAMQGVDTILHLVPISIPTTPPMDDLAVLDMATRGTYVLMTAARAASVSRMILASTLDLFERLPARWRVDERWRPRPLPNTAQLCAWLAELSARECARVGSPPVTCLRFGRLVNDEQAATQSYDPSWLHLEDALQAVRCALQLDLPSSPGWRIYHIAAAGTRAKVRVTPQTSGQADLGYEPVHDFRARWPLQAPSQDGHPWEAVLAPQPMPSRPIRNVVIFGAGGPVGAVTAQELSSSYTLRLADVRPIPEIIAEGKPQMPGAPLPSLLGAPHEYRIVDVREPDQVMAACEGMDAIINLTVVRHDPVDAFRVNTLGAINIMRAAVAHGIRRVVQTGPLVEGTPGPGDYSWDYDVHVDAPARPYDQLYIHSKYLGQEACRVFADHYGLEVPVLLFGAFVNPRQPGGTLYVFAVSWEDSARAIRRALEVPALPAPCESFNVTTDLPQGRFSNGKTKQMLGWVPRDRLEHYWSDPAG